jgi:hypothetical protein
VNLYPVNQVPHGVSCCIFFAGAGSPAKINEHIKDPGLIHAEHGIAYAGDEVYEIIIAAYFGKPYRVTYFTMEPAPFQISQAGNQPSEARNRSRSLVVRQIPACCSNAKAAATANGIRCCLSAASTSRACHSAIVASSDEKCVFKMLQNE